MKLKIIAVVLGIAVGVFAGWYASQNKLVPNPDKDNAEISVFFGNAKMNPNAIDCAKVFEVKRSVTNAEDIARASLYKLFEGPTVQEISSDYNSIFSEKTSNILRSMKIQDGIAYIDFYDIRKIIPEASASCGGAHFLASINETLKQFPNIKKTIFAINGDPAAFYDWMQIGCPAENNNCDPAPFR